MDKEDFCYLPDNCVGQSKPSKIIERLYEKRKNAEHQAIEKLNATKSEIINRYNDIAKKKIEELKKDQDEIRQCIKNELFESKMRANKDNAENLQKESFDGMYKSIEDYSKKRILLVENWHRDLSDLELAKSKEFKKILETTYENIKTISYKLPREYDELIELEIEKINQEILCNHRAYNEMKVHLELEVQNDLKGFIEELWQVKNCWIKFIKNQTSKSVSALKHQTLIDIINSNKTLENEDKELREISSGVRKTFTVECVTKVEAAEEWLRTLRLTLGSLDQTAQKILSNFKKAMIIFFNRFFEELKTVSESLTEMVDRNEVLSIQCEMYTPTLQEMKEKYDVELEIVQQIWNDLVGEMTKTVDNTYKFLIAGSTLFEKHFQRLSVLQIMVQKEVNNTILANNHALEMCDIKLNILLDTLRQEPTQEKLNKTFEEVKKYLVGVDELCRSQCQAEIATSKKYKVYLDQALDVLISEINRFLVIYPPDLEKDPKIQRKRASQTSEIADPKENLIPNQIWFCKFEVDAIMNWGFGLWESINSYALLAKAELQKEGEQWISNQIQRLERRLEIRINMTKIKFAKIQTYIYNERLRELNLHKARFEEHKQAAEKHLNHVKDQYADYLDQYNQVYQQFNQEIQNLESRSLKAQTSSIVSAYMTVLKAKVDKAIEDIEKVHLRYLGGCTRLYEEIKSRNVLFMKRIRFFSEEGNFNILESKDYIKHMAKLEGQIEKDLNEIKKRTEGSKTSMISEMEKRRNEVLNTLNSIREEYLFKELVEKKLKNLASDIRNIISLYENNFSTFATSLKRLEEDAMSGCGDFKYFNVFDLICDDISKKAKSLGTYLDHPLPMMLYSDKSNFDSNLKLQVKKSEDQISTYTAKLFNFPIDTQESRYLTELNYILLNYWKEILAKAKKFYEDRHHFYVENSKHHHTLDAFLHHLYKAFLPFQNQFESTWIKNVKIFTNVLSKFIPFYEDYNDVYLSEYHRKTLKGFENWFEKNIKEKMAEKKEYVKNMYMRLQRKLKALHGHPRNKHLLDKLKEEAEVINEEALEMTKDLKSIFFKNLQNYFDKAVEQFYSLKDSLPSGGGCFTSIRNLKSDLQKQHGEKVLLARSFINWFTLISGKDPKLVIPTLFFLDSTDNKTESNESHQGCVITRSVSTITSDWEETSILSFADVIEFTQEINELYDRCYGEIEREDFEGLVSTLKQEWECAVERVLSFYTVRYDVVM